MQKIKYKIITKLNKNSLPKLLLADHYKNEIFFEKLKKETSLYALDLNQFELNDNNLNEFIKDEEICIQVAILINFLYN